MPTPTIDSAFFRQRGRTGARLASVAPIATATPAVGRQLYRLSGAVSPVVLEMMQRRRLRSLARGLAGADLLYSNTLQNGELLRAVAARMHSPLACARTGVVAEASDPSRRPTVHQEGHGPVRGLLRVTLGDLVEAERVAPDRIALCHSFIEVDEAALARARGARQQTRRRLGIPPDARVVGGVGTMDWRKGPESLRAARRPRTRGASPPTMCTSSGSVAVRADQRQVDSYWRRQGWGSGTGSS